MTELPAFRYYPDAAADGTVVPSEDACSACGQARGFICTCLLYSEHVPDDAQFCPWCIADGSACARFGGSFNEVAAGARAESSEEVRLRTPGFPTWQDWAWPTHCDDVAIYRGQPDGAELRANPPALDALLDELRQLPWGHDAAYVEEFIDGLGGSNVAYVFDCPHCGATIVCWDTD